MKKNSLNCFLLATTIAMFTFLSSATAQTPECNPQELPLVEGFESWSVGENEPAPACWVKRTNNSVFTGRPSVSDYFAPHGGSKSLSLTSYPSKYTAIVLPPVNAPIDSLQITFWLRKRQPVGDELPVIVGVTNDSADISSFSPVDTVWALSNEWALYEIPLDSYSGLGTRLALMAPSGHNGFTQLDDLTVDYIPACPHPTNLTFDYATGDSIVVHWNGNATNSFFYIVSDGINDYITDDTSFAFSGLQINTEYLISVRNYCITDDTSSTIYGRYKTLCGKLFTLPYSTDFDSVESTGYSAPDYEPCWNRFYNYTYSYNTAYIQNSSEYNAVPAHSGNNYLRLQCMSDINNNQWKLWTTLPELDTVDLHVSDCRLTFYARNETNNNSFNLIVGVMDQPDSAGSFHPVDTISISHTLNWTYYEIPLNRYNGTGSFITLMAERSYWNTVLLIDDLVLEYMPTCPPVTDVQLVLSDMDNITLTWNEVGNASIWSVEHGLHGFTPGTGIFDTAYSVPFTVNGLTSNTEYDFIVRPLCGTIDTGTLITCTTAAAYINLPLAETFADNNAAARWTFLNPNGNNHWTIGDVLGTGDSRSMYISNDDGATYGYDITSASASLAYVDVMLRDSGDYYYSYEYICQDIDWVNDFMRVFLIPASVDLSTLNISSLSAGNTSSGWKDLNSSYPDASEWTNKSGTLYNMTPGVYHLLVAWKNNNATDGGKPGAIDNIFFQKKNCYKSGSLYVIQSGSDSITVGWSKEYGVPDSIFNPSLWQIIWDGNSDTVTAPYFKYTIHNLTPSTQYNIKVRMICGEGDTGMYTTLLTSTKCGTISLPYSEDFDNIHSYTSTNVKDIFVPCWGQYQIGSYSSGSASMPYVGYQSGGSYSGNYALCFERNAYVYLPEFDAPLDSIELSFWLHGNGVTVCILENESFQQYTTIQYCPWSSNFVKHTVRFDNYTGNGRRIAIKAQGTGSSQCYNWIDDINVQYRQYCNPVTNFQMDSLDVSGITMSWNDSVATQWIIDYGADGHLPGDGNSTLVTHPYIMMPWPEDFDTFDVFVRPVCSNEDSGDWAGPLTIAKPQCEEPDSVTVTATEFSATLHIWASSTGNERYNIVVSSSTDITPIFDDTIDYSFDTPPLFINNLEHSTTYSYKVRRICDRGFTSEWTEGSFTTLTASCTAPNGLVVEQLALTSAEFDWEPAGGETAWKLRIWNTMLDTVITTTLHPYTMQGLSSNVVYNCAVRSLCYNGVVESEWSPTVSFTTAACPVVEGVNVSLHNTSVDINWNETTGLYELEWGTANFEQGHGNLVSGITDCSYTINGLTTGMAYDVYVRSICDDGVASLWSQQLRFTAGVGLYSPTETTSVSLNPNPASNYVTLTMNGINTKVTVTLTDVGGHTVLSETFLSSDTDKTGHRTILLNLKDIRPGAYFVRIKGNDIDIVRKLIKK